MNDTRLGELVRRANELTVSNVRGDRPPAEPLPLAAESPLLEVLVGEVAAKLPAEVAARLRAAGTRGELEEWLTAGAVYGLLRGEPDLARQFLEAIGDNPRAAALTLARVLASRMGPPPMARSWHACDRLGVLLQLAAACAILLVRALLLHVARPEGIHPGLPLEIFSWPGLSPDLPLSGLLRLPHAAWFGWLGLWFGVEAVFGPRVMEFMRRRPSALAGEPRPVAWRADALHLLWALQAGFMLLVTLGCSAAVCLGPHAQGHPFSGVVVHSAVVSLLLVPVVVAVACDLRHTLALGTGPG